MYEFSRFQVHWSHRKPNNSNFVWTNGTLPYLIRSLPEAAGGSHCLLQQQQSNLIPCCDWKEGLLIDDWHFVTLMAWRISEHLSFRKQFCCLSRPSPSRAWGSRKLAHPKHLFPKAGKYKDNFSEGYRLRPNILWCSKPQIPLHKQKRVLAQTFLMAWRY